MPEVLIDTALTTLERVKDELNITVTTFDSKLTRYINEATDYIEYYTGRNFGKVVGRVETLVGSADNYLIFRNRPIILINSIENSGDAVTDFLVDADDYNSGMVYRDNGWPKSAYIVGLAEDPFGGRKTYVVNYDFGYILPKNATAEIPQTLPRSLEAIAIKLVTLKHKENTRDSYGLKELKQGRLTLKFKDEMLSDSESHTLRKFKRIGVW